MTSVLELLTPAARRALEAIAERRGVSLEEALVGAIVRDASIDEVRAEGWHLLVEKDGTVRELADA